MPRRASSRTDRPRAEPALDRRENLEIAEAATGVSSSGKTRLPPDVVCKPIAETFRRSLDARMRAASGAILSSSVPQNGIGNGLGAGNCGSRAGGSVS
jgi:hypothetical protein